MVLSDLKRLQLKLDLVNINVVIVSLPVNVVDFGQAVAQAGHDDPVITGNADDLDWLGAEDRDLPPHGLLRPPPVEVAGLEVTPDTALIKSDWRS